MKLTEIKDNEEYVPRKLISERYSLDNIIKQRGLTVEEFKVEMYEQLKTEKDMIDEQLSKGLSFEQAECHVMRCLYIDGFSGPTFKD